MKRDKFKYVWEYNFDTHHGKGDGSFLISPVIAIQINKENRGIMIGWFAWLFAFEYTRTKIYTNR